MHTNKWRKIFYPEELSKKSYPKGLLDLFYIIYTQDAAIFWACLSFIVKLTLFILSLTSDTQKIWLLYKLDFNNWSNIDFHN